MSDIGSKPPDDYHKATPEIYCDKPPKTYYVDLEDGFVEGDIYLHKDKVYEVIRIEAFNQLMEVQEVEDSQKLSGEVTSDGVIQSRNRAA